MAKELMAEEIERKRKKAEYDREYRRKNKERLDVLQKERYEKNKDKIKARRKVWYEKNKEREYKRKTKWRLANKDRVNARARANRGKHRDRTNAKSRAYYHAYPEKRINRHYKKNYGITIDDYNRILLDQNGGCAICGNALSKLQVDHCHKSGEVRGLLCKDHNMLLGLAKDNIQILDNAIKYLKKYLEVDDLKRTYKLKINEPVIVPQNGVAGAESRDYKSGGLRYSR